MKANARPDVERELSRLKDFQRATVDYVHDRLYGADPVRRFLVADEVGLGKTLVARGVIAKAIDHLWDSVDRIDVVYICSNNQIAGQNLKKLRVGATEEIHHADRLTMLPKAIGQLQGQKVNFVSFTPGTSFNLKGSGGGKAPERVLLYRMLQDGLGDSSLRAQRWVRFFEGGSSTDSFKRQLKNFDGYERDDIPPEMVESFATSVTASSFDGVPLLDVLYDCADEFNYLRKGKKVPYKTSARRYRLIGQLRHLIAEASVAKLEPDLVILDEFQRFKSLMDTEDETSELAHALFNHADAKLLLLSATPFKMYTLPDDEEGEDHYEDFQRTVEFLAGKDRAVAVTSHSSAMRTALYAGDVSAARDARDAAQAELRRVMVRTERLAATPDRDGMITAKELPGVEVSSRDVKAYVSDAAVGNILKSNDILEYWRSSPYLFEFMDAYQVKKRLEEAAEGVNAPLAEAMRLAGDRLSWDELKRYQPLDPGNAKMRGLVGDVLDRGAWKLAWIPPSLPYYELGGAYAEPDLRSFTKRLIFSSWTVVPKAIGAVMSYEAERRLLEGTTAGERAYDAARATALLTFQYTDGRYTGMPVLGILYPSLALAEAGDPLRVAQELNAQLPVSAGSYLARVRERVEALLGRLPDGRADGAADDRWYWAAPFLFDHLLEPETADEWLPWGSDDTTEDARDSRFDEHVEQAMEMDAADLGRRPDDLVDVLTSMAAAAPGVVALRAFARVLPTEQHYADPEIRMVASMAAWALRSMFNRPEITAVVRSSAAADEPYWRSVVAHCYAGGLEAVLDEYLHVLFESQGLFDKPLEEQTLGLIHPLDDALTLRSSTSSIHFFDAKAERVEIDRRHTLRSHFAVRFGRGTAEDSAVVQRESQVREAYNSPFWPFVLASTSVGQEGLDFHQYSHAIVHWNLPGNPVDLEQREGRVHRYKGHAVRKNAASAYGSRPQVSASANPWQTVFDLAAEDRPEGESEVFPYWVFPGQHAIERYTPVLPLSKETHALERLMRTVGAYRLVVGQPRQEDLLRYLGDQAANLTDLGIDLTPPFRAGSVPLSRPLAPSQARQGMPPPARASARSRQPRPNDSELAIQTDLQTNPWSSASDVGKRVGLSAGTVRGYLHGMHRWGLVELKMDSTARSPRGNGVSRYRWLDVPLGEPEPTELWLCDACATGMYGSPQRYHWATTEDARERHWEIMDALDDEDPAPPCDRCAGPVYDL